MSMTIMSSNLTTPMATNMSLVPSNLTTLEPFITTTQRERVTYPDYYYRYGWCEKCYCYDWCYSNIINPTFLTDLVSNYIVTFYSPILLVFGLIGNTLIIVMFRSKEISNIPSKPLFIGLAFMDNLVLLTGLLIAYLNARYGIDIAKNDIACKFDWLSNYTISFAASWFLVAMTIDRFICIMFPLKVNLIRTKHRIIAMIVLCIMSVPIYGHLWVYVIYYRFPNGGGACAISVDDGDAFQMFYRYVWPWMDTAALCIVPSIIIVVCDIAMVRSMRKSEAEDVTSTKSDDKISKKLTKLFVTISVTYILTTLPVFCYSAYHHLTYNFVRGATDRYWARISMVYVITWNIRYLNNGVNIVIYCYSGTKFRNALRETLPWMKKKGK